MGFIKPKINKVVDDVKNVSIYLRSVKKWGKSTLFRDVIRAKYNNDLERGVLVECGLENGDSMLNSNMVHLDTYKEFIEFKKWLITEKGNEHNIEIVCFDTADELIPIFEKEVIRLSNLENPQKQCKSIKGAFGGYNAGVEMAAEMIKKYMGEIKSAGFGVWVIAHSKFKTIREKGGLEEDGYMQLTSNLINAYESAFGDIFDVTLTGVIDRVFDEKKDGDKVKKYTTDSIRKLYFRGTPLIDAGGRFASDTVPEYLEYDCPSLEFAEKFIKTVEDGLKGSMIDVGKPSTSKAKSKPKPIVEENVVDNIEEEETVEIDVTIDDEVDDTPTAAELITEIKSKVNTDENKKTVISILKAHGEKALNKVTDTNILTEILNAL